jgi:hypothetical protein
MVAGKYFGGAVARVRRINGYDYRDETLRKRVPRNVVLVQRVTRSPRRLENQFVLKKAGLLSVHYRDGLYDSLVAREPGNGLTEIDDGIEAIEAAFISLDMVLPTATNVRRVDQISALQKTIGILPQGVNLILGEHAVQDSETVTAVLFQVLCGEVPGESEVCERHKADQCITMCQILF